MSLISKRRNELKTELQQIEKQIYELETSYLEETKDFGNIFTGWTSYISNGKVKPKKVIFNEDRLFSLSSVTSPASRKEQSKKRNSSVSGSTSGRKSKAKKENSNEIQQSEENKDTNEITENLTESNENDIIDTNINESNE
eukprot:gene19875-25827_t